MRLWVLSVAVLFAIAVIPTAKATDIKQPLDVDFKLEPLSENLTQKTVVQTFQDSRGVLWFLTQEGLNKYNGYTLENFRYSASDNSSISSNEVTRITEDSKGVIWISTLGGGLNKYNPINNGFTAVYTTEDRSKSPLSNYISTVFSDFQGTLWLGYKNAFSSYSPDTGEFVHYVSGTNGVPILGIVNRFSQTTEGTIWAATQSGLFEINPSTKKFVLHSHEPLNPNTISSNDLISVSVDKSNNVWSVSRDLGISIFNTTSHTTTHLKHDSSDGTTISSNQAYDAFQDLEGRMWIGTYSGLNLYSEETGEFIRFTKENTNLPSNRINSIFQSREGKFWVGTYYGLAGGMPNLFPKINSANSHLSSNSVNAFEESSDGSLWVGTDDGLNRLRPDDNTFEWINESTYPKISRPDVMSLLADSEFLWIGTFNGGLNKLNLTSNEVKVYSHDRLDMNSVGANGITSLLRTEGGKILIGTFGGGLSIYRPETDIPRITLLRASSLIVPMKIVFQMIWSGHSMKTRNNSFGWALEEEASIDGARKTGWPLKIISTIMQKTYLFLAQTFME
jgi:ligand-binding sensor domain-containing protein